MNQEEFTGRTEEHIHLGYRLHEDIVVDFERLKESALIADLDIQIASGFRSYNRQLSIWNNKATGIKPIFDADGNTVDPKNVDEKQLLYAILNYSAIPGFSRHHWGTDLDVFSSSSVSPDYQLKLSPDEYSQSGPFNKLTKWLNENMDQFGFYRPYPQNQQDKKGVAYEPWHLSHKSLANHYAKNSTLSFFKAEIEESELELKECILKNAEDIFEHYINIKL